MLSNWQLQIQGLHFNTRASKACQTRDYLLETWIRTTNPKVCLSLKLRRNLLVSVSKVSRMSNAPCPIWGSGKAFDIRNTYEIIRDWQQEGSVKSWNHRKMTLISLMPFVALTLTLSCHSLSGMKQSSLHPGPAVPDSVVHMSLVWEILLPLV